LVLFSFKEVAVSLPSIRPDTFNLQLAEKIQEVKKTGLTFAPEAGTQRLRDVINKKVTEKELMETVESAFRAGWRKIKLYFMIGLPTESEKDLKGIVRMVRRVLNRGRDIRRAEEGSEKGRPIQITASASVFIPKPHSVFQWFGQPSFEEIKKKQDYLKDNLKGSGIVFDWHDAETSFIEAVLSRGDRRLGAVLKEVWKKGSRFEGWSKHFKFSEWEKAFAKTGVEPEFYANRNRNKDEIFPWDHIDSGIDKSFLYNEYHKALKAEITSGCRQRCNQCGICTSLGLNQDLAGELNE